MNDTKARMSIQVRRELRKHIKLHIQTHDSTVKEAYADLKGLYLKRDGKPISLSAFQKHARRAMLVKREVPVKKATLLSPTILSILTEPGLTDKQRVRMLHAYGDLA